MFWTHQNDTSWQELHGQGDRGTRYKENMKKAVFLDRDGTMNFDSQGYISKPEDFKLFPFTAKAIATLNAMEFLVFVVTNQSGIARGYYTFEDIERVHEKMHLKLTEQGARIDGIFISPYYKNGSVEPFNIDHEDRKPGLGLFQKARAEFDFEVKNSFMIGDKYSDISFGRKAGLKTILVRTGNGNTELLQKRDGWKYKPHYIVNNLLSAVKLIEKLEKNEKDI